MTFPGGIADKAGNRYEAKWAVLSLLYVILGRAAAIRVESPEKAAQGFEFELHRNGLVEWHQTKRQGKGNWTLLRLENEAVLTNFRSKLTSSPANQCLFVSGDPAKEMKDLVEKALVTDGFEQFDRLLPEGLRPSFLQLQRTWHHAPAETFSALRRCEFRTLPEAEIDRLIAVLSGLVFDGQDESAFPILREYLEHNLNRLITTEAVRVEIGASGLLRFRDAALDPTLRERVQKATKRYLQSYIPFSCGGHTIPRPESRHIIDLLCQPEGPRALLLTGVAGSGKSGVVREVIEKLVERRTPVFAFRVDRVLDVATVADLGQRLIEQRGNPCVTLSSLFPSTPVVMVVDQVDAISEASGRAVSAREMVLELVDTAWRLENVRLALVCRSFDLDNDARLRMLVQDHRIERVDVQLLDWEQQVKPVLITAGVDVDQLTQTQRKLLTLPLNLSIFMEVTDRDEGIAFASTTDLFDRLVERKGRALRERGIENYSLPAALAAIAQSMSDRQLLDAPAIVLDPYPAAVDILTSEYLIARQDGQIAFFHESFFDYAFSRDFVRRGHRLIEFLASDEQHLFRRTQVRQILTAYRHAGDRQRYLAELGSVLLGQGIRYHLRDAVARWIGTVEGPTGAELDLVLGLDREGDRFPPLLRLALCGNPAWFPLLRERGLLDRWLSLGNGRKSGVFFLLETAAKEHPEQIAAFLRSWWNGDHARSETLVGWFSYLSKCRPSQGLLNLYLDLIRSCPRQMFEKIGVPRRHELSAWMKNDPAAAGEALKTWFETWFTIHPEGHPFADTGDDGFDLHSLVELANASPEALLHGAVTGFIRTLERIAVAEAQGKRDWTWRIRYLSKHIFGSEGFLEVMRVAFRTLAGADPVRTRLLLAEIDPGSHSAALYLHLEAIAADGATLADLLPSLTRLESLFEAGPNGANWVSFAEAARSALPHLPASERENVEQVILCRWPEIDLAKSRAQGATTPQTEDYWLTPAGIIRCLNRSGFEQWAILKTIGNDALSLKAQQRLAQLDRKFVGEHVPERRYLEATAVASPIPQDRAQHMTDDQWLEAIRTHKEERHFWQERWPGRGGPAELAQVLQMLTKAQPARFSRLLSRIPEGSPHNYRAAILRGLTEAELPLDDLRHAVQICHSAPGKPFGHEICRLIEKNPAIVEDETAFNILCWYVEHGEADPAEQTQATKAEEDKINIKHLIHAGSGPYFHGISQIRGIAAEALGAVIWECRKCLETAVALLERRIEVEALISVRCCLMRAVYSVLHHDQVRAADLMRRVVVHDGEPDVTPLMTHIGVRALYHVLHGAPDIGRELLDFLLGSSDDTAHLIGAYHLFREAFGDDTIVVRADALIEVDLSHRMLAADVAAGNLAHAATRSRAVKLLLRFFNDPDRGVRIEAADCFRHLKHDDLEPYRALIASFVASQAFEEDNFAFFMLLKDTAKDVHNEVLAAAERLIEIASCLTNGSQHQNAIHYLDDLIIREYAALSARPDQRSRVLNVIDRMLELGLSRADEIVSAHERL